MYLAIKLCASFFSEGLAIVSKPRDTLGIVIEQLLASFAVSVCGTMV